MTNLYATKNEVHDKAAKIVNIKFGDLSKLLQVKQTKSSVGDLFEAWFGKAKDSDSAPDLGVAELKATPYKKLKNGQYSAKERLVLNIINYMDIIDESFDESHFIYKNKVIELAFYEYLKDIPRNEWSFSYVALYEMAKNPVDFAIIKNDWHIIQQCIIDGKAEELTESMTSYLAACTKGSSAKTVRKQPNSEVKAKQRAFSLKSSYMTELLRNYIIGNEYNEAIISDVSELQTASLYNIIESRFSPYVGKTTSQISAELNLKSIKSKHLNNLLVRGMLGLNTDGKSSLEDIKEFRKGSYQIKTVQFDSNGQNKESMSFPAFKFKDLVTQDWLDEDGGPAADINVLFSESTFIFVVFQTDENGNNLFKGIKLFTMPQSDIDGAVKRVWEDTITKLKTGINLKNVPWGKEHRTVNNFIKESDDLIIHVRPHSSKASYVDNAYSDELPVPANWINKPDEYENNYMTKQCFFLNNGYIKVVVHELLS